MRYDIRAKVRTYKDKQTGDEKAVYATIGSAWIGENTSSIQLDQVPLNWDGHAFLNEPFERDEKPRQQDIVLKDIEDKPVDLSEIPF